MAKSFIFWVLVAGFVAVNCETTVLNKVTVPFLKTVSKNADSNVVYSPVSLVSALNLVRLGAGGQTLTKLNEYFGGKNVDDALVKLNLQNTNAVNSTFKSANMVLHSNAFALKDSYRQAVSKLNTSVEQFDPKNSAAALKRANDFVKTNTNDMIERFLDQLPPRVSLVLLNAIALDAKWKHPFNAAKSHDNTFYGAKGEKKLRYMSDHLDVKTYNSTEDQVALLELDYLDNLSMLILLPHERNGLPKLLSSLTPEKVEKYYQNVKPDTIIVTVPKFEIEAEHNLKETLPSMNLGYVFDDNVDLSNMVSGAHKITEGKQKAVIKVDEDGTKAAAATGFIAVTRVSFVDRRPPFLVDHPFMFILREKSTNTDLFVGFFNG